MRRYFHVLEFSRRWCFQFVRSLQTERTLLDHHDALFYEFRFIPGTKLSFITGIDQGCRVEVRRRCVY